MEGEDEVFNPSTSPESEKYQSGTERLVSDLANRLRYNETLEVSGPNTVSCEEC